jgi:hypothetical protein
MKPALPALLAVAVASEFIAENLHESFAVQPHVEPEVKVSNPIAQAPPTSPVGSGNMEPLGILRQRILYAKMRRANLVTGDLAMADAFIATARAVMRERALQPFERQIQFDCLRGEIELIHGRSRGCRDYSNALPAVANALDIPYNAPFALIFPRLT